MTPGDLDGTERRQQLRPLPPHVPKVRGPFQPGQLEYEKKFEKNRKKAIFTKEQKVIAESGSNFSPSLHSITASQAAR